MPLDQAADEFLQRGRLTPRTNPLPSKTRGRAKKHRGAEKNGTPGTHLNRKTWAGGREMSQTRFGPATELWKRCARTPAARPHRTHDLVHSAPQGTAQHRGNLSGADQASRGFEPRSLDSESRVLAVTPRGPLMHIDSWQITRQLDGAIVPFDHEGAAQGVSTFPQPPAPFERKAADPNTQPMQGGS